MLAVATYESTTIHLIVRVVGKFGSIKSLRIRVLWYILILF